MNAFYKHNAFIEDDLSQIYTAQLKKPRKQQPTDC